MRHAPSELLDIDLYSPRCRRRIGQPAVQCVRSGLAWQVFYGSVAMVTCSAGLPLHGLHQPRLHLLRVRAAEERERERVATHRGRQDISVKERLRDCSATKERARESGQLISLYRETTWIREREEERRRMRERREFRNLRPSPSFNASARMCVIRKADRYWCDIAAHTG